MLKTSNKTTSLKVVLTNYDDSLFDYSHLAPIRCDIRSIFRMIERFVTFVDRVLDLSLCRTIFDRAN